MNWKISGLTAIAVGIAAALIGAGDSNAKDGYQWKMAHQWPTVHPYHQAAEKFVQRVEERTGGRLRINMYPAGQLFGMREIPEAVVNGAIELGMAADVGYSGYAQTVAALDLPMLAPDSATAFRLLDGEFGQTVIDELAAKGMTHLAWIDYGPMNLLTGTRQVKKPADLEGLRITVPGGLFGEAIAALGGTPVTTPPADHYLALQRNIVDGILVGPSSMSTRKLHEAQKYLTVVDVARPVHILTANTHALASLPPDLAAIVREEARSMQDAIAAQTETENAKAIALMAAAGIVVHEVPAAETAEWRNKLMPVHAKLVEQLGPTGQKLLDLAAAGR